jgi:hypothetical protein
MNLKIKYSIKKLNIFKFKLYFFLNNIKSNIILNLKYKIKEKFNKTFFFKLLSKNQIKYYLNLNLNNILVIYTNDINILNFLMSSFILNNKDLILIYISLNKQIICNPLNYLFNNIFNIIDLNIKNELNLFNNKITHIKLISFDNSIFNNLNLINLLFKNFIIFINLIIKNIIYIINIIKIKILLCLP